MTMSDWLRDFAFYILPFAVIWLVWKTDRLGRQIEASTKLIQLEIAQNDEERERELRAEFEDDKKQERKAKRTFWITWGTIGAIVAAWFLLSSR